jgi:hypothetical protein
MSIEITLPENVKNQGANHEERTRRPSAEEE